MRVLCNRLNPYDHHTHGGRSTISYSIFSYPTGGRPVCVCVYARDGGAGCDIIIHIYVISAARFQTFEFLFILIIFKPFFHPLLNVVSPLPLLPFKNLEEGT
ncbi:hypothetical protein LY76DRAFT_157647 [Colletotrichum caudatum]|nr:hypothetical protein LY76DRAFT_157647 [Colletotrichum caudatum]